MATNSPSTRYPFTLPEDIHPDVRKAIEWTFNGLVVHEQAFAAIKTQVDSTATLASTASSSSTVVSGVSSFNSETGSVIYFPGMGTLNDQLGAAAYTTQQSDNGAKIVVGDSSAVAITLNSQVTAPWFCIVDNDSSAVANLTTQTGTLTGANTIQPEGFGIITFDGTNFWCGATAVQPKTFVPVDSTFLTGYNASTGAFSGGTVPLAADSSLGVVYPDGVTIGITGGAEVYTQVTADSGAPAFTPSTPGNPFYFDSSATPWQGYVWFGNAWHPFQ